MEKISFSVCCGVIIFFCQLSLVNISSWIYQGSNGNHFWRSKHWGKRSRGFLTEKAEEVKDINYWGVAEDVNFNKIWHILYKHTCQMAERKAMGRYSGSVNSSKENEMRNIDSYQKKISLLFLTNYDIKEYESQSYLLIFWEKKMRNYFLIS